MKHIKCVLLGDHSCDKTALLVSYTTNTFPNEYISTIFDDYSANISVEDQAINLILWDTSGQEDYKRLRQLSYSQTDIFIILFSLVSPTSLENAENMWLPEIKEHCPKTPYILVGVKKNLRDEFYLHESEYKSKGMSPISFEEGNEMKKKIGARDYIECDVFKQYHINEVFESAVKVVLHNPYETIEENLDKLKNDKKQKKLLQKEEKKRRKQMKKDEKKRLKMEKQAKKNEEKQNKKKLHVDFNVQITFKIHYD